MKVSYWIELSDYDLENAAAPFSHSLSFLAKKADIYDSFSEEQKNFIDILEPMNIEARYPVHKEQLLRSLTEEKCIEIYEKTQDLHKWIMQKL